MKKVKITKEQFNRLSHQLNELTNVKGGVNRVNKSFSKDFANTSMQKLSEEPFNIKKNVPGIPNSKMTKAKAVPEPKQISESIFSPEIHDMLFNVLKHIWLNPSQEGLDKILAGHGITWGDIISYFTGVGVISAVAGVGYKIRNIFKRKFNKSDAQKTEAEKLDELKMIVDKFQKDFEQKYELKLKPEAPKPPQSLNKLKNPNSAPLTNQTFKNPVAEVEDQEQMISTPHFKADGAGKEFVVLTGTDGKYIFDYADNDKFDISKPEDVADFVNTHYKSISKGIGMEGWEKQAELIKLDDKLKNELMSLYSKDQTFISLLNKVDETTGAASSGAFTAPLGISVDKELQNEVEIDDSTLKEMTAANGAGNSPQSSPSGQYTQPAIWANGKKNWKGAKKTLYPDGEIVDTDKSNKGTTDGIAKTHKTKDSVISRSMYETIAEKTGRSVEDIKKIIESKINNKKSLA